MARTPKAGLLSDRLQAGLTVSLRTRHCAAHPLFGASQTLYSEVSPVLCEHFAPQMYADREVIFNVDRVAERLFVTHKGSSCVTVSSLRPTQAHGNLCELSAAVESCTDGS